MKPRISICRAIAVVLGLALLMLATSREAQSGPGDHQNLGVVEFPISCAPEARAEFERGVALLHHMMYVEARGVFGEVAADHPDCAMAHWGVAMTLFQPLWPTRPGAEQLQQGWEAVARAKELTPASAREQALIAAAEAFYSEPESSDYWARIDRFERAMKTAYDSHPEDHEIAAFYALSHLATASQAEDRQAHLAQSGEILLSIYEKQPAHPGAVHYTIHATDADGRESEALDVVRSYDDIAPSVPHALHMPTHIFVRLGDWEEVIRWNERSAEAALNFPAGDSTSHHYVHALDYLAYAHLQRAEDERANEVLTAMTSQGNYQKSFISAYHLAALPARYAVERHRWTEAAKLPLYDSESFPWEKFPWPVATLEFARGLGAARTGDPDGARQAVERLAALEEAAEAAGEAYFAGQIEISRLAVSAWLAHAEKRPDEALSLMRSSAELEASTEKHPVTPGAVQPAYESLGELLLEMDHSEEALEAFQASLEAWPKRFNSLAGAARAAARSGQREQAAAFYAELLEVVADASSDRPALREAKAYLAAS